jgi:hypothetical protein
MKGRNYDKSCNFRIKQCIILNGFSTTILYILRLEEVSYT